jgi:hypothetical protein
VIEEEHVGVTMPLPQGYYHVYPLPSAQATPSVNDSQATPSVNDWQQQAYWQTYAEWQRQWQVYALWQAYAQLQQGLLAGPLSPCNDDSATKVETGTPPRKRNRIPTLRSDIEDVKRAGLPIRSIQRTADGHFIHIGEPIINTGSDNDNNDDASDRSEWQ